jgi:hypothetical protein
MTSLYVMALSTVMSSCHHHTVIATVQNTQSILFERVHLNQDDELERERILLYLNPGVRLRLKAPNSIFYKPLTC